MSSQKALLPCPSMSVLVKLYNYHDDLSLDHFHHPDETPTSLPLGKDLFPEVERLDMSLPFPN